MRIGDSEVEALYKGLLDAARLAPGVEHAAVAGGLPFSTLWAEQVKVPGRDSLSFTRAGGPYFNAVGARLLPDRRDADTRGARISPS